MAKLELVGATASHRASIDREVELRRAQGRAFDEVKLARSRAEREFAMERAVADLIDACDRYISEGESLRS